MYFTSAISHAGASPDKATCVQVAAPPAQEEGAEAEAVLPSPAADAVEDVSAWHLLTQQHTRTCSRSLAAQCRWLRRPCCKPVVLPCGA